jgi:hypothetical protein
VRGYVWLCQKKSALESVLGCWVLRAADGSITRIAKVLSTSAQQRKETINIPMVIGYSMYGSQIMMGKSGVGGDGDVAVWYSFVSSKPTKNGLSGGVFYRQSRVSSQKKNRPCDLPCLRFVF